jgi:hypothetical protein
VCVCVCVCVCAAIHKFALRLHRYNPNKVHRYNYISSRSAVEIVAEDCLAQGGKQKRREENRREGRKTEENGGNRREGRKTEENGRELLVPDDYVLVRFLGLSG